MGESERQIVVLGQADVLRLLPMGECIEVMERTLVALARGETILPLRSMVALPDDVGLFVSMPAYLHDLRSVGIKAITVFPGNEGTELDAHQGAILLFETERGRLLGVFDATSITAIRTGAVTGVGTRALAREDARDVAILGSGTQARTNLEAVLLVRPVRRVRVWSRTPGNARRFAEAESHRHGIEVEVAATARDAVEEADIVCTVTSSPTPVLEGAWLAPGAHVNAVGFAGPAAREVDTETVVRSRLYADRRESCLNESGDFLLARAEGAVGDDHLVGEVGEVLVGKVPGRRTEEEITMFESLGLAVEDVAAAHHLLGRAVREGTGARVAFGGYREP